MPRDLFAQSLATRPRPKRSKWTIAGSILAHAGFVAILLIAPVLSALDEFVAIADDLKYVALPDPMPVMPVAPPPLASQRPMARRMNPDHAPLQAADNPSTDPPPAVAPAGPPGDYRGRLTDPNTGFVPGALGESLLRIAPPPAPPTSPPTPRRAGGDIKPPARTYYVEPVYSTIARAAGVEGYVILEATIDATGIVRNVTVLRSQHPLLTPSAVEAVSKWKYTPTTLNGVAVPIILTVTVNFALR